MASTASLSRPQSPAAPASAADLVRHDDTRLSDARTPTAHAATHAPGGDDDLSGSYIPLAQKDVANGIPVLTGSVLPRKYQQYANSTQDGTIVLTGDLGGTATSPTVPGLAGKSGKLTPTGTKTAAYTATAGELVMVDATAGPVTITLPTAAADLLVGVKRLDASTNAVTVARAGTDTIGALAATSVALVLQDQSVTVLGRSGSWALLHNQLTLATLDARYSEVASNLSDLASAPAARTNLGVYVTDTPAKHSLLEWNYDPMQVQSASQAMTSGTIYLCKITPQVSGIVSNIVILLGTAGVSLTANRNFAALFDSTGTQLKLTADQSTAWATTGTKTMALSAAQAVTAGQDYYVALLANWVSTAPQPARAGSSVAVPNVGLAVATYRFAVNGTGQTSLPASLTLSSNTGTNAQTFWVGLS